MTKNSVLTIIEFLKGRITAAYYKVVSSIAFFPAVILLFFFGASICLLSFEDNKMTRWLLENVPVLVINNADTARALLSTVIAGLISLMVFSFSMVMMILSQASNNYSPRLLPGLVSDKRNQFVLGVYLGTIVYNIIVLISVLPDGKEYTLHGFSILLGIVFSLICLIIFIYFIHNISRSIQIGNILHSLFETSKKSLDELIAKEDSNLITNDPASKKEYSEVVKIKSSGYLSEIPIDAFNRIAKEKKAKISVDVYKGQYLLPGTPLFTINQKLSEEELEDILSLFILSTTPETHDNHIEGINHIVEVGIKAMSPGINDPGTAIYTLNYIAELLALRMQVHDTFVFHAEDADNCVHINRFTFDEIMNKTYNQYREYCKHDLTVMTTIIETLKHLWHSPAINADFYDSIRHQLLLIGEDVRHAINNKMDQQKILDQLSAIQQADQHI